MWEKLYAPAMPSTLVISGDRTQHVLCDWTTGISTASKPQGGRCHDRHEQFKRRGITPPTIIDGVTRAIVNKLRAKLPETKGQLVAIFPRNENIRRQRGKNLQVNQALRSAR